MTNISKAILQTPIINRIRFIIKVDMDNVLTKLTYRERSMIESVTTKVLYSFFPAARRSKIENFYRGTFNKASERIIFFRIPLMEYEQFSKDIKLVEQSRYRLDQLRSVFIKTIIEKYPALADKLNKIKATPEDAASVTYITRESLRPTNTSANNLIALKVFGIYFVPYYPKINFKKYKKMVVSGSANETNFYKMINLLANEITPIFKHDGTKKLHIRFEADHTIGTLKEYTIENIRPIDPAFHNATAAAASDKSEGVNKVDVGFYTRSGQVVNVSIKLPKFYSWQVASNLLQGKMVNTQNRIREILENNPDDPRALDIKQRLDNMGYFGLDFEKRTYGEKIVGSRFGVKIDNPTSKKVIFGKDIIPSKGCVVTVDMSRIRDDFITSVAERNGDVTLIMKVQSIITESNWESIQSKKLWPYAQYYKSAGKLVTLAVPEMNVKETANTVKIPTDSPTFTLSDMV